MMKLDGRQIENLWTVVRAAYNRQSLTQALRFDLDRDIDDIAPTTLNDKVLVFELIVAANREGWVERLIVSLRDRNTGNQELQTIIADILASQQQAAQVTAALGIDPHTACLIGRHVLVNREDLRSHMRHFTTAGAFDPRLVVVTGPDASGKSYTREFVTYLAAHFKLNSPVFLEMNAWPGGSCSPDDLISSIATQMGIDTHDLPANDQAQGARRAIKLKDWFIGKIRDLDDEQWIVFDDLDHPGVPPQTLDLVDLLVLAVARNAIPKLRMVLLGYERPFRPDVTRDILFERLTLIDEATVRLHARDLTAQYLNDQQEITDEGKTIADAALQNLTMPFDRKKLETFTLQLDTAVSQFLTRI